MQSHLVFQRCSAHVQCRTCRDETWQLPLAEISSGGTSEHQILGTHMIVRVLTSKGYALAFIHQDGGLGHHWSYFQHGAQRNWWVHVGAIWQERKSEFCLHCLYGLQSQSSERIGNFRESLRRGFDGSQWEWRAMTTPQGCVHGGQMGKQYDKNVYEPFSPHPCFWLMVQTVIVNWNI